MSEYKIGERVTASSTFTGEIQASYTSGFLLKLDNPVSGQGRYQYINLNDPTTMVERILPPEPPVGFSVPIPHSQGYYFHSPAGWVAIYPNDFEDRSAGGRNDSPRRFLTRTFEQVLAEFQNGTTFPYPKEK